MAHAQYTSGTNNDILGISTPNSSIIYRIVSRQYDTQDRHPTAQIKPSSPNEIA